MTKHRSNMSRITGWALVGTGHVVAVLTIFLGVLLMSANAETAYLFERSLADAQLKDYVVKDLSTLFGLSVAVWGLLVFAFRRATFHVKASRRVALVRARGTVMTETLIIFPVFLLLTFGLGQMAVNSMAGLLTTLATYEAARTVAVWGPEVNNNRTGTGAVSVAQRNDRARVAAAGVLAPVAPTLASGLACQRNSKPLNDMLKSMVGAGVAPTATPRAQNFSFSEALDDQSYSARGWLKLNIAYCSTQVAVQGNIITDPTSRDRAEFTTTVSYFQKTQFPLVGLVFRTQVGGGPWTGSVSKMERSYTLTQQISPNPELPERGVISNLFSPSSSGVKL
ncbi:MAG: pilus assembly protein [bacterium]